MIKLARGLLPIIILIFSITSLSVQKKPIIIAVDGLGSTLYPPQATGTFNLWALHSSGNRLVRENDGGQIFGDLASSWQQNDQGNIHIFHLKNSLPSFCDQTVMQPIDIIKSIKLGMEDGKTGRLSTAFSKIKAITLIPPRDVQFELRSPDRHFERDLADPAFTIFKSTQTKALPCLSGPFRIESLNPAELHLKRSRDNVDIIFKVQSHKESLKGLAEGSVAIAASYSYFQRKDYLEMKTPLVEFREGKVYFLAINTQSIRFKKSVDRNNFLACLQNEKARNYLKGYQVHEVEGAFNSGKVISSPFNAADKSECNNIKKRKTVILTQKGHEMSKIASILFECFTDTTVLELDKNEAIERIKNRDYDVFLGGLSILTSDPAGVSRLFEEGSRLNFSQFSSPEIRSTIENIRSTTNLKLIFTGLDALAKINRSQGLYYFLGSQQVVFALGKDVKITGAEEKKISIQESGYIDLNKIENGRL